MIINLWSKSWRGSSVIIFNPLIIKSQSQKYFTNSGQFKFPSTKILIRPVTLKVSKRQAKISTTNLLKTNKIKND